MSNSIRARRYKRIGLPKGMQVAWEHYGIRKVSRVSVLAVGGIFISTPDPPARGDIIKVIFEVPGGDVSGRAIVRDSQPKKGMGIEFTGMSAEARARLAHLMRILTQEIPPVNKAGRERRPSMSHKDT
jgi:hypothetical protein